MHCRAGASGRRGKLREERYSREVGLAAAAVAEPEKGIES